MISVSKPKVKELLDKKGACEVVLPSATVTIRLLRGGYHIIVKIKGESKPLTYVYRTEKIAIDRFCEQVEHFRRDA